MLEARDVMTGSLITCSPKIYVAEAARLMRDRNIGDVLVIDEGKIVGIVTDRDIAVRVNAKSLDASQMMLRDVMTTRVVTGERNWNLDKIAKVMGENQIRRLPIAEKGMPIGMVSLSDVALHNDHGSRVARSLKKISEPRGTHRWHSMERSMLRAILGLGLIIGAVVGLKLFKSRGNLWEQLQDSQIGDRLLEVVQAGRDKMAAAVYRN